MKKLFAIIMSVLMIACFMPTMAFASGGGSSSPLDKYEAKIGNVLYETLEDAISAAKGDETIDLLKDVEITKQITHEKDTKGEYAGQLWIMGKKIIIEMNGHNITLENGNHFALLNGKLEFAGSGTVQEKEARNAAVKVYVLGFSSETTEVGEKKDQAVIKQNLSSLVVGKDVTLKGYDAVEVNKIDMAETSSHVAGASIAINGTLIGQTRSINAAGDTLNTKDPGAGIAVSGEVNKSQANGENLLTKDSCGTIAISLGDTAVVKTEDGNGNGIMANGYAEWTLGSISGTGPTITAENAISAKSGKFTINSGTYTSTGEYANPADAHYDGAENAGAALNLLSNDAYLGQMDVTINGGTFVSEQGNAVYEGIGQGKERAAATASKVTSLAIKGGTFTGAEDKDAVAVTAKSNFAGITGGTYSDLSALEYTGTTATVGLTKDMTVSKATKIKDNATLKVAEEQTLTVANNLEVAGKLLVDDSGTLIINKGGVLDLTKNSGNFENTTDADNRTLKLAGANAKLVINEGGTLSSKSDLNDICNYGELTINAGGVITVGTDNSKIIYIGGEDAEGADAMINLTSGSVVSKPNTANSFEGGYTYTLQGTATASGIKGVEGAVTPFAITGKDIFVVDTDAVLNANQLILKGAKEGQLQVKGTLNGKPKIGDKSQGDASVWEISAAGGTFNFDPYEYLTNKYVSVKDGKNWTVKAYSAEEAGVTVAPLHDNATGNAVSDNELAKNYCMNYNEDGSVTINVHPQYHTNDATPGAVGKWIGIGITVPEDAKKVTYTVATSAGNGSATECDATSNFEGKTSLYWDYAAKNVTSIKYKFDKGPEYTLNIKVNATPTEVKAAPLGDTSGQYKADQLNCKIQGVEYKDGVATVKHTGLLKHVNGAGTYGSWVGIGVPTANQKASTDQYIYYSYDNATWQAAALEGEEYDGYVYFYADADKLTDKTRTIYYAFGKAPESGNTIFAPATGINAVKMVLSEVAATECKHICKVTETTESTCSTEGKTETKCLNCGEVLETTVIANKAHTEETMKAVPATCTSTGLTEGKKCSVCGEILTEQKVVEKAAHDWGDEEILVDPTCEKAGTAIKTCKNEGCGYTEKIEKPATGHEYGAWTYTWKEDKSECTASRTCEHDSAHVEEVNGTVTSSTVGPICETAGKTTYTAKFSKDGETFEDQTAEVAIPATGHSLEKVAGQAATTSADGWKDYYECKNKGCTALWSDAEGKNPIADLATWKTGDGKIAKKTSSGSSGGGGGYVAPSTDTTTNTAGSTTTTVKPSTTTVSGVTTTTATVSEKTGAQIVDKAVSNKSTEVVVNAATGTAVKEATAGTATEVAIPAATISQIVEKTDAAVVIKSDVANVTLDKAAVEAVAAVAGTTGNVKLVVKAVAQDENKVQVELKLETANGTVSDFKGGNVTVTVKLSTALAAKDVVCVYIDDNRVYHKVNGQKNADGTFTFTTQHFSSYAVMEAAEADKVIAEQATKAADLTKELSLKASSTKTAKGSIKVTLAVDEDEIKAIEDLGYTVKYKFYRSTKKGASYKAKIEGAGKTYTNTSGKKGTKYYYKARVMVYDAEGALVAKTALSQCKYAARTK